VPERSYTRQSLLRLAAGGLSLAVLIRALERPAAAGVDPVPAPVPIPPPAPVHPPELRFLSVTNGGRPFARDHRLHATVSQSLLAARRSAFIRFRLDRVAKVEVEIATTRKTVEDVVWRHVARLGPGRHGIEWLPDPDLPARTYLARLAVTDRRGRRTVYGGEHAYEPPERSGPVVRVLGVEAVCTQRSYAPGQRAKIRVETDAEELTVQVFRSGPERVETLHRGELNGVEVTEPRTVDWRRNRSRPGRLWLDVGDWPSGVYFARLAADDGRLGFAPFVVRPARYGESPVAVVLPTHTWAAYNHHDADGDGWGDTWYAGGNPPVELVRPHHDRGVPFRFKAYDLGFVRWLHRSRKTVDFLAQDDLERFRSGDELAALYDLIVFNGHHEYVTEHEYDLVERYRDLGGHLWFLSANNFFWKVERRGTRLYRREKWRDLGRPEAALVGVQYLANDEGGRQGPFVVSANSPLWPWQRTGKSPGDVFGGYGIEIDARTRDSPPGTRVLATIPDVFGPGRSAEMTYYEHASGAKVFAGGVLNFGGSAERWAVRNLLENMWTRMLGDRPPDHEPD
jgi:hypothetical protein